MIVCGRWGRDVLAGTDLPVREICAGLSDTPTMAEALEIAETLKNLYRTGEADEIHLVYQRFDSVLHQTPVHRQLLPAAPEADAPAANNNYLFVPDAQTVLDNVLELYLNNTVYAVMENPGGCPLQKWLEEHGTVTPQQACAMLEQKLSPVRDIRRENELFL